MGEDNIYFNEEWNEEPPTNKEIVWRGLSKDTFNKVNELIKKLDDN
jgi:hypothetical protein